MMLRATLTALATCLALPAAALCSGESYLAQLQADDLDRINAAVAATPNANGLLWTLTQDDKTITVVGTMHIFDARLTPIRDRVLPVIQTADLLMVEATAEEEAAMQNAFIEDPSLYLITQGPTLPDLLSDDVWEKVKESAGTLGLPSFLVAKMQPWYLSLSLGIPACAMSELAAGQRGLDHMLTDDALAHNVPLQALESWEVLIDILTDGTQEEQIELLKLSLVDPADKQALFVAMLDAYFSEQIASVWEISQIAARNLTDQSAADAAAQMAETQEILLDQRNQNWLPIIETAATTHDDIVVAVGAAHLPGETGILALLDANGWTLARFE